MELFYSPSVLSADGKFIFQWLDVQFIYYLIENAQVFIGGRSMRLVGAGGGFLPIDEGFYGGLKLVF
jgi:hypothetical protein